MDLRFGIENFVQTPNIAKTWGRCGLLANQASVDQNLNPSWRTLQKILGSQLVALFGPQHGFEATVQDNMIETKHSTHLGSGLPVYSLYSETRTPTEDMLANVDTILVDIQITGCRVYTFKYTIAGCLRAALKYGKKVVVFDRPNPLGGIHVAGRVLNTDHASFVGEFAIPMQHGLTPAEASRFFNKEIGADLEVIKMEQWQAEQHWDQLGRRWILTSPNLPNTEGLYLYPGTVLLEGVNLSEGRGTCLPFQFVGAPYIRDPYAFASVIRKYYGEDGGVILRPTSFQPSFQKWVNESCQGVQIHVKNSHELRAFELGLAVIRAGAELGDKAFAWKEPPYEYEYEKRPIRLLLGHGSADERILAPGFDLKDAYWHQGIDDYIRQVADFLLYPRQQKAWTLE